MKTVYNVMKLGICLFIFTYHSPSLSMQNNVLPRINIAHKERNLEEQVISAVTHTGAAGAGYFIGAYATMLFYFSTSSHDNNIQFTTLNAAALAGVYKLSKILPDNSHTTAFITALALPFGLGTTYYSVLS